MDLVVNEEFTKMYSEEELLGARRIQVLPVHKQLDDSGLGSQDSPLVAADNPTSCAIDGLPSWI